MLDIDYRYDSIQDFMRFWQESEVMKQIVAKKQSNRMYSKIANIHDGSFLHFRWIWILVYSAASLRTKRSIEKPFLVKKLQEELEHAVCE